MATPSTFDDLAIINAALTGRMGENRISNLASDTSKPAIIMRDNYQQVKEACLTHSAWRFNTAQASLNKHSATPTNRWAAAWSLPPDRLKILYVWPPIRYQIIGNKLYCDETTGPVKIDYQRYLLEGEWPAWFRDYVIAELTVKTYKGITGDDPTAAIKDDRDNTRRDALFLDAQQQPNPEPLPNPFVDCRY